jgi:hypothetical protein
MSFLKQSYISFANLKLHEANQFSKILSKSLEANGQPCQLIHRLILDHLLKASVQSQYPSNSFIYLVTYVDCVYLE